MAGRKKVSKATRKKVLYLTIALLLVGGLLLSVMVGFFDFLTQRNGLSYSAEDEYILDLKGRAASLEETLEAGPVDPLKKAELANTYYELAMYYFQKQDLDAVKDYSGRSRELFEAALGEGLSEPWLTLRIALLALLDEDEERAEAYLHKTLQLDEEYAEAHLFLGEILFARGMKDEARVHWERVLELVEKDSLLAQTAQYYLQVSTEAQEEDSPGEKGE